MRRGTIRDASAECIGADGREGCWKDLEGDDEVV